MYLRQFYKIHMIKTWVLFFSISHSANLLLGLFSSFFNQPLLKLPPSKIIVYRNLFGFLPFPPSLSSHPPSFQKPFCGSSVRKGVFWWRREAGKWSKVFCFGGEERDEKKKRGLYHIKTVGFEKAERRSFGAPHPFSSLSLSFFFSKLKSPELKS